MDREGEGAEKGALYNVSGGAAKMALLKKVSRCQAAVS